MQSLTLTLWHYKKSFTTGKEITYQLNFYEFYAKMSKRHVLCTFFNFYDFYDFYANYEPTYNMLKYPSMYLYGKLSYSIYRISFWNMLMIKKSLESMKVWKIKYIDKVALIKSSDWLQRISKSASCLFLKQ